MEYRKMLSALLVPAMVLSLVACGSTGTSSTGASKTDSTAGTDETAASSGEKVTLTMWQQWGNGHEAEVMQETIDKFEKENPNITIDATCVTDSSKILTAISGGNPPDILSLWDTSVLGEWASQGALTDLTPYIEKDAIDKDAFVPKAFDTVTYDGGIYGMPFILFNASLIYNADMFTEAGLDPESPPKTFDELLEYAKKLTKVDANGNITQLGFVPTWPGSNMTKGIGYNFGANFYDESTKKITANDAGIINAFAFEQRFFNEIDGVTPQDINNFVASGGAYLTADDLFESGKLAMVIDGPWSLQYVKENAPDMDNSIKVAYIPTSSDCTDLYGTSYRDCNPQIIPAGAAHPEEAWKFISWETTNEEVTKTFAEMAKNLSQLKSVELDSIKEDSRMQLFADMAASDKARSFPAIANGSEYVTNLNDIEGKAMLDKTYDYKAALDDLNTKLNK